MPDLCIEAMDISGEFQNLVVTSGIVQKGILENASLLETGEWPSSIQHLPHTELHTKGYCYKEEMGYCPHCAESWQGKSPSAYISVT